ncbi:MAG: S8 family serine peptidase [bacterium]
MQGSFLDTKSRSTRLALLFSVLFVLALFLAAALPPASSATQEATHPSQKRSRPEFVPGQALVRYRSERLAKQKSVQWLASKDGRQISIQLERFDGADIVPGLRLAHVAPEDTMAAIAALKAEPDVLYAEPNYLLHLDLNPNDPRFLSGELYGLTKIGAPTAWNTTTGNNSVVVGVVDEGIDKLHPDLAANIWINPAEIAGNGIDDDGNGFIDDVNGYNFADNTGTIPAEDHATHVAGTIGAVGNNGVGVVGVNWQVRLMSLKFIGGQSGATSDAIRAENYAKQMHDLWISSGGTKGANVRVVNNSWGGGQFSQALLDAILGLNQAGILFVAAAGNDAANTDVSPHYPSSYDAPNVISVAATDSSDGLASFSNFGAQTVHLGAPGVSILSTERNNTYALESGTSMATPHVAGAAALLLSANPNLTVQQLKSLLVFNGDPVSSLNGKTLTGRRLNVGNSFQARAENDTTPPGTVTAFHLNTQNGRALNVGWTNSGDDGAAGQASLYQLSFTDGTTGTVINLKNVVPGASGVTQALDVKLPYRHTSGTLTLREFDNVGNEGVPATIAVSVSLVEGDPYLTSVGSAVALSTGGTPLGLIQDDGLYSSFHSGSNYSLPFSFPFFGQNFSSVDISTNGNLYFSPPPRRVCMPVCDSGDADDVPSSAVGLAQFKMISGLWDDLRTDSVDPVNSPCTGCDVFVVNPDPSRIIFRWKAVTFGNETVATQFPVNFEIELRSNGTIITRYGAGQSAPINTNLFPVVGIGGGEPEAYVIPSHTSEEVFKSLTNAPEVTFLPRANSVLSSVQFSLPQFQTTPDESSPSVTITVARSGDTSTPASVDFATTDGSATQKGDYMFTQGRLNFAAGQTTKTFPVFIVNDSFQEGTESFSVMLSNPIGTTIGAMSVATVKIFDNDLSPGPNPLDNANAQFFVRQHYLDFLNREPDAGGLAFWANQITECDNVPTPGGFTDAQQCREVRRINVSAAFFLSIEFQETGYLVERMYKVAYGDDTGTSTFPGPGPHQLAVPIIRRSEFLPDTLQISNGVVIGQPGADQLLEANKVAFTNDFVTRTRFSTMYLTPRTPAEFVDALIAKAGFTPTPAERTSYINEFGTSTTTVDTAARARVVRRIAENGTFTQLEKNNAFVLMQFFGYLRRDPNTSPDTDYTGYDFWRGKLIQFNGNFVNAEMVKAFIVSGEYRGRFGP